jgi:hypothetical protein
MFAEMRARSITHVIGHVKRVVSCSVPVIVWS